MYASRPIAIPPEFTRYNQLPRIGLRYRVRTHNNGLCVTSAELIDGRTSRVIATLFGHTAADMMQRRAERLNARSN